ncbi:transposase [Thomasclavelia sp.]
MISEIGVDMKQFKSDKQLTCWAELVPTNNESANKKSQFTFQKQSNI